MTIDRATFGATHVRQGTKIDNLVQIAHNVTVGEHGIIVAQVGIAGSTTIGKGVMIGGQAGLIDHLTIGRSSHDCSRSGNRKRRETRCQNVRATCDTKYGLFPLPYPGATTSGTKKTDFESGKTSCRDRRQASRHS